MSAKKRGRLKPSQVAEAVRQAIFEGRYQPGEPLPELHLAEQFKVSQATVREALSSLAHAGLLRRFPNKGSFVTALTAQEVAELVRLRTALEEMAAADAALRAAEHDLGKLREAMLEMKAAAGAGDYFRAYQADLGFHRALWRMAGGAALYRLLDQVTTPLFAFVSLRRSQRHDTLANLVREHEELLEAVASKDPETARRAARLHIERAYTPPAHGLPAPMAGETRS
jgi:DNA-binding GntR family transcriptional regulator